MMETPPETIQPSEAPSAPTVSDADPHFAAEYLVALLSARIESRKKSEREPQDVALQLPRTSEP